MTRTITAGVLAQLTGGHVRPVFFAEVEFASGTTRMWGGVGPIDWDGQTWTGAGNLLAVSAIQETVELQANGASIALNAINTAILAAVFTDVQQGLPAQIWLGFLDAVGAVIADPIRLLLGRVDVPTVTPGPEHTSIALTLENRLVDLQRPRLRRYTPEDQKARYPDDRGFDAVPGLAGKQLQWGTAYVTPSRPVLVLNLGGGGGFDSNGGS